MPVGQLQYGEISWGVGKDTVYVSTGAQQHSMGCWCPGHTLGRPRAQSPPHQPSLCPWSQAGPCHAACPPASAGGSLAGRHSPWWANPTPPMPMERGWATLGSPLREEQGSAGRATIQQRNQGHRGKVRLGSRAQRPPARWDGDPSRLPFWSHSLTVPGRTGTEAYLKSARCDQY